MSPEDSFEGPRKRAKTSTSSFGVSKREGHDSSMYYNSKMYDSLVSSRDVGIEQPLPEELNLSLIHI